MKRMSGSGLSVGSCLDLAEDGDPPEELGAYRRHSQPLGVLLLSETDDTEMNYQVAYHDLSARYYLHGGRGGQQSAHWSARYW